MKIEKVEKAIETYYHHVGSASDLQLQTEQVLLEQVNALRQNDVQDRQRLVTRQKRLLDERGKRPRKGTSGFEY